MLLVQSTTSNYIRAVEHRDSPKCLDTSLNRTELNWWHRGSVEQVEQWIRIGWIKGQHHLGWIKGDHLGWIRDNHLGWIKGQIQTRGGQETMSHWRKTLLNSRQHSESLFLVLVALDGTPLTMPPLMITLRSLTEFPAGKHIFFLRLLLSSILSHQVCF